MATKKEPIQCPHCERTFKSLDYHAAKKSANGAMWAFKQKDGQYKCPECKELFPHPGALGSHRRLKHDVAGEGKEAARHPVPVKGKFVCPECGKVVSSSIRLGNHRWTVHRIRGTSPDAQRRLLGITPLTDGTEKLPDGSFKCPICGKTGRGAGMGMHMKMHKKKGQLPEDSTQPTLERTALVKANQNAHPTTNGNHPHPQAEDDGHHRLEAAATLAAGRVQELCSRLAFEHDLPARTFTALVLRTVANASAIR